MLSDQHTLLKLSGADFASAVCYNGWDIEMFFQVLKAFNPFRSPKKWFGFPWHFPSPPRLLSPLPRHRPLVMCLPFLFHPFQPLHGSCVYDWDKGQRQQHRYQCLGGAHTGKHKISKSSQDHDEKVCVHLWSRVPSTLPQAQNWCYFLSTARIKRDTAILSF